MLLYTDSKSKISRVWFRNETAERFIYMLNDAFPNMVSFEKLYVGCIDERLLVHGRIHLIAGSAMALLKTWYSYDGINILMGQNEMNEPSYYLTKPLASID